MLGSRWIIDKSEVTSKDGLVVTKDILASQAGVEMLKQGGNAVDAAVASAFAISVVEPWMTSIGGGGFMLIHLAREKRTLVVDFAMRGPLAGHENLYDLEEGISADLFGWRKVKGDANIHGWRSIAVPGAVAGLCYALQHYGRLSLKLVMAPAIRYARDGFPVTWHTQLHISAQAQLLNRYPETAKTFFKNGVPKIAPYSGVEMITQPDLAHTLETIANEGPEAFYKGSIARQIARAMAEHGGLVTEEDLARYQVRVLDPAPVVSYGPYQVFASPCPSGGTTVQETLAILNGTGLETTGHNSADGLHLIAEASRLAWADRFRYLSDPDLMSFPWQNLFDPEYAATRRGLIDRERAMSNVVAGTPERLGGPDGSTTALSAADGEHNLVTITKTVMSSFGSHVTVPGTGIVMNNGMYWFDPEPGKANSVGSGQKPLNNMAPLLVLKDGKPHLAISSSGGRKIPNANLNILLNATVYGLGMQAAVSAPRIDLSAGNILADDRISAGTLQSLRDKGHQVASVTDGFQHRLFASPACVRIDPESGLLTSGVDPFYPAVALGL